MFRDSVAVRDSRNESTRRRHIPNPRPLKQRQHVAMNNGGRSILPVGSSNEDAGCIG